MRFSILRLLLPAVLAAHHALAAGAPVVLISTYSVSSAELRDQLIGRLVNVSRWACTNEPGVAKYAIAVPWTGDNSRTIHTIEQYDDDASYKKHLANSEVAMLTDWSKATPGLFTQSITVQNLTAIDGMTFVKAGLANAADPLIVLESQTYDAGGVHHLIDHWEEEVDTSRSETGTLAFGLYEDPKDENTVHTVAVYESEKYMRDVHAKSAAALELEEHGEGMRKASEQILLKKSGGFLYRGTSSCG